MEFLMEYTLGSYATCCTMTSLSLLEDFDQSFELDISVPQAIT